MIYFYTPPWDHQRKLIEDSWSKEYYAIFVEPRCGKAKMAIDTAVNLYMAGLVDSVLYVAKKGELSNFQVYEIPAHMNPDTPLRAYVYRGYDTKQKVKELKDIFTHSPELRVFSQNIESIRTERGFKIAQAFLESSPKSLIVIDESTCIKETNSKQHKAMIALGKLSAYRRIMTGTVQPKVPLDVYAQCEFLKKGCLGFTTKTAFKAMYDVRKLITLNLFNRKTMRKESRKVWKVTDHKNLPDLHRRIKKIGSIILAKDCGDMKEPVRKKHAVMLSGEQIRLYNELLDYQIANLPEGPVERTTAMSVENAVHQVLCGQLVMPDGSYKRIKTPRIDQFVEKAQEILETEKQIILWCGYSEVRQALSEALTRSGVTHVHLAAGLSMDERAKRIDKFKKGEVQAFLGNWANSGYGLSFYENADVSLFYHTDDNYEQRFQAEQRTKALNKQRPPYFIDFMVPGSIEEKKLARHFEKAALRDAVIDPDALKRELKLPETVGDLI